MGVPLELSVIIATRNRSALLGRCIESLRGQTQDPATFEVLVADDGSSDGSAASLDDVDTPFRLRVLALPRRGQAAAQNEAIAAAEGRICLFLDDDVIADSELIREHLAAQRGGEPLLGIGGITQAEPRERDWYAASFARAWNRHYASLADRRPDWTDTFGGNLSVPREALVEVGGFSTELPRGEDVELGFRLARAGCVPRYLPRAHGLHDDQKRRRALLEDSRRQGAAAVELSAREPAMM